MASALSEFGLRISFGFRISDFGFAAALAMNPLHEKNESLWLLTLSPAIWAAHFMLCYLTAAIWCAKLADPDGSLGVVRVAIAIYTVLALAGIGITGWVGYRKHRFGNSPLP